MRLPLATPLAFLLLLLCLGLGARIERQLQRPEAGLDLTAPDLSEPRLVSRPASLPAAPEAAPLAAIEARPLFSPDRRPWPSETAPTTTAALGIRLSGTVISDGERIAILTAQDMPGPQRLRVGDSIAGWTIESIEPNRVILLLDDRRQELKLSFEQ